MSASISLMANAARARAINQARVMYEEMNSAFDDYGDLRVKLGRYLKAEKEKCAHGEWGVWLEEAGIPRATAHNVIADLDPEQREKRLGNEKKRDARRDRSNVSGPETNDDPTEGMAEVVEEGATCSPLVEYTPSDVVKVAIAALKKVRSISDRTYVKQFLKEKW